MGTPTGWIIVRDALLIGPWHHPTDRSKTYRRTPNDYEAEHILLRTIRCASGEVQTMVDCEPVLDYGNARSVGIHRQELLPRCLLSRGRGSEADHDQRPGWGSRAANQRPDAAQRGDVRYVALSWGGAVPPMDFADAYKRQVWTAHHWQHWLARGQFLITPGAATCSEAHPLKG